MPYNSLNRIVFLLIALLNAFGVQSQDLLRDTITIESITVYRNKAYHGIQAGVKSILLDSLVINEKRNLSLAELLQENSPIFIKTYGRGATATASLRGTSASHTNVYWNGIKINSPMSGEADFSLVPLYFVDEVAIHFGQSSMGYGSGGLGGAVSLQSTPNWSKPFTAKVYQSVGSYQTYSTAATSSYGKNKVKAQTRFYRETSYNNFTYRNIAKIDGPIEVQQDADYEKHGVLQEVYYRLSPSAMVSARIWAQLTDRSIPKLMTNSLVRESNRQLDANLNAVVDFRKTSEHLSWKLTSGLSALDLKYSFNKFSLEGNNLPVINAHSKSWSWYNRGILEWNMYHWLSVNFQAEANQHWVESAETILGTGYVGSQMQNAVRIAINAFPIKALEVNLLLGEEIYPNLITPLSYGLALKYRIFKEKEIFANGGVSRNYHYPSLNDLYWQPGGNINLKAEDALSWEAGFQYLKTFTNTRLEFDINLFSSQIENWIMWLPHLKGYWEPVNLSQVNAQGAELSIMLTQKMNRTTLKVRGNYSNTQSTISNASGVMRPEAQGKQLPFIPVHSGGLLVNALWRNFQLTYSFTHFSERYTTTSNNPNSFRRLYPYYMSSAALGWDFKFFETPCVLQLRIDNLLNESYQTILWRPMPGRNYTLTVRVDI